MNKSFLKRFLTTSEASYIFQIHDSSAFGESFIFWHMFKYYSKMFIINYYTIGTNDINLNTEVIPRKQLSYLIESGSLCFNLAWKKKKKAVLF